MNSQSSIVEGSSFGSLTIYIAPPPPSMELAELLMNLEFRTVVDSLKYSAPPTEYVWEFPMNVQSIISP